MAALNQICAEKNLSPDQVLDAVRQAIATAYRKDYGNKEQEIRVVLREDQDMPTILLIKEVVDVVENENIEIGHKDAVRVKSEVKVGDELEIDVTPHEYGRIAAQAAKQVILQKIQEAEKQAIYEMFKDREDELLTATVTKVEPNWVTLEIEKCTVSLPWREQIPDEHYYTGKRIRVYLSGVELTPKGPQLRISRTHQNLVKRLLELEIPEIRNGDVKIMAVARDPGFRTKVAVKSADPRIDPIGACVGQRGVRIQSVMEEIGNERVDIIEWSDDPIRLISTSLQPAAISAVIIVNDEERSDEEGRKIKKRAAVFVEPAQRPMAIGKKGQNIRLATQLSGYELDMYDYDELSAFQQKLKELGVNVELPEGVEVAEEGQESIEGKEGIEGTESEDSKMPSVQDSKQDESSPSEAPVREGETALELDPEAKFAASKTGKNYYPIDAPAVKRIKTENRMTFKTTEEAEAAGYIPAA